MLTWIPPCVNLGQSHVSEHLLGDSRDAWIHVYNQDMCVRVRWTVFDVSLEFPGESSVPWLNSRLPSSGDSYILSFVSFVEIANLAVHITDKLQLTSFRAACVQELSLSPI